MAPRHMNRNAQLNCKFTTQTALRYTQITPRQRKQSQTHPAQSRKSLSHLYSGSQSPPISSMSWLDIGKRWLKSQKAEERKMSRTPSLLSLASTLSSPEPVFDVENDLNEPYDMVPEAAIGLELQNGTLLSEAVSTRSSPKKAVQLLGRIANEQLTVRNLQKVLDDVSDGVSNKINEAMEGKDAVEMLNSIVDTITYAASFRKRLGQML